MINPEIDEGQALYEWGVKSAGSLPPPASLSGTGTVPQNSSLLFIKVQSVYCSLYYSNAFISFSSLCLLLALIILEKDEGLHL